MGFGGSVSTSIASSSDCFDKREHSGIEHEGKELSDKQTSGSAGFGFGFGATFLAGGEGSSSESSKSFGLGLAEAAGLLGDATAVDFAIR